MQMGKGRGVWGRREGWGGVGLQQAAPIVRGLLCIVPHKPRVHSLCCSTAAQAVYCASAAAAAAAAVSPGRQHLADGYRAPPALLQPGMEHVLTSTAVA